MTMVLSEPYGTDPLVTDRVVVKDPDADLRKYPDLYAAGSEPLDANEMRLTVLGSGYPSRRGQGCAGFMVELGNGEVILFDAGAGTNAAFNHALRYSWALYHARAYPSTVLHQKGASARLHRPLVSVAARTGAIEGRIDQHLHPVQPISESFRRSPGVVAERGWRLRSGSRQPMAGRYRLSGKRFTADSLGTHLEHESEPEAAPGQSPAQSLNDGHALIP